MDQGGKEKSLEDLRVKIDEVDSHLLELMNVRADLVHAVGEIKKVNGLEIYAPEREEKLLQSLVKRSEGRLPEKSIRAIYREIMSAALALEEHLKIAYLGPQGSWTHQAARNKFGASVEYVAQENLKDVFEQVSKREADYGVVPMGGSAEGEDKRTLDYFVGSSLQICAQVPMFEGHSGAADSIRFLVLGHNTCPPTGKDSTALLIQGEAGDVLSAAKKILSEHGLSATRIDGREETEAGKPACVILEVEGHHGTGKVAKAVEDLTTEGRSVQVLGSYPASRN